MTKLAPSFSQSDVEIVERHTVYRGFFKMELLKLKHRLFNGGWSQVFSRELFARGDAVAAILYDPVNDLIGCVEQFRVGALQQKGGPWCLEVVAGMTKPGELPAEVILREIDEEAGLQPRQLVPICDYLSSPGGSDERLSLFCALCDLKGAGGVFGLPEENEDIRLIVQPAQLVLASIYDSRYNNAATLICLQWLVVHRSQLRDSSPQ